MPGSDTQNNIIASYLETLGFSPFSSNGKVIFSEFTGKEAELETLYKGVGLRYLSTAGIIEMRGADVLDFLHRITTNALKDLPKESVGFTIFTSEKGRIIDTASVLNFGDYQLMVCSAENKSKVISWINKYVISDDVKAADAGDKYILLELTGRQSDSFMTLLCGDVACKLDFNTFKVVQTEGMLFFIIRLKDETGNIKYWLLADKENGLKLVTYMVENKGPFDFNLVGESAYTIYRVERGIPAAPGELNDSYNPHEAGLLSMVSFTKGCYIGQEVIARLDTYGKVQKKLMGVIFQGTPAAAGEYHLKDDDGNDAGVITSLVYSHHLKKHIGLAYIKKNYAFAGALLNAFSGEGEGTRVTAAELPFRK